LVSPTPKLLRGKFSLLSPSLLSLSFPSPQNSQTKPYTLFASWVLEGRGRKCLGRGKPLFESFKKTRKGFGGF